MTKTHIFTTQSVSGVKGPLSHWNSLKQRQHWENWAQETRKLIIFRDTTQIHTKIIDVPGVSRKREDPKLILILQKTTKGNRGMGKQTKSEGMSKLLHKYEHWQVSKYWGTTLMGV